MNASTVAHERNGPQSGCWACVGTRLAMPYDDDVHELVVVVCGPPSMPHMHAAYTVPVTEGTCVQSSRRRLRVGEHVHTLCGVCLGGANPESVPGTIESAQSWARAT